MIKIRERTWRDICRLAAELEKRPNYADANALMGMLRIVEQFQPLRAKSPGAGFVTCTDIATGKPIPINTQELLPFGELHLGDD
jgi:hypothetical protein